MAILVKDLIKFLNKLPEDTEIVYQDPNFSGDYYVRPELEDFNFDGKYFLISFPFESPVN